MNAITATSSRSAKAVMGSAAEERRRDERRKQESSGYVKLPGGLGW